MTPQGGSHCKDIGTRLTATPNPAVIDETIADAPHLAIGAAVIIDAL